MAEREGTAATGPERPRRGETHCLSPKGELCVSSAGPGEPRSSAQRRARTAPPHPRLRHAKITRHAAPPEFRTTGGCLVCQSVASW